MSNVSELFAQSFAPEKQYMQDTLVVLCPKADPNAVKSLIDSVAAMSKSLITDEDDISTDVAMSHTFDKLVSLHPRMAPGTLIDDFISIIDDLIEAVMARFNETVVNNYNSFVTAVAKDASGLSQVLAR